MWQQIFKTYFIGQIALEQAADLSKKSFQAASEKAQELSKKAEEYKRINIVDKLEVGFKEGIAELRKSYSPFENACETLSRFLSETGEIKNRQLN